MTCRALWVTFARCMRGTGTARRSSGSRWGWPCTSLTSWRSEPGTRRTKTRLTLSAAVPSRSGEKQPQREPLFHCTKRISPSRVWTMLSERVAFPLSLTRCFLCHRDTINLRTQFFHSQRLQPANRRIESCRMGGLTCTLSQPISQELSRAVNRVRGGHQWQPSYCSKASCLTFTICLFPTPIKSLRTSLPGKLRLAPHAPIPGWHALLLSFLPCTLALLLRITLQAV